MVIKHAEYNSPGTPGKSGFEDLECYKLALAVMSSVHQFAKSLPPEEKYDLAVQIRRSSKAIAANIAEGYGRYHYLDSLRIYSIARGEINETLAHLINARILSYINQENFETIYTLIRKAEATLNGYMNYVRKRQIGHKEYGDRFIADRSVDYLFEVNHKDLDADKEMG